MTRTLMLVAVAMATLFMGKAATAAPLAPAEINQLAKTMQIEKAQYYVVPKYNQHRPRYHHRYHHHRHHARPRYYAPHRPYHHGPRRHHHYR